MIINVFWTGGLDSTCRIFQLSKDKNVTIQPYYIIDRQRHAASMKLDAIYRLTKIIREQEDYAGNLLDTILTEKEDVPSNEMIRFAYENQNSIKDLGTQYPMMAEFIYDKDIYCEFSMEKVDNPKFRNVLFKYLDYDEDDYHYTVKDIKEEYKKEIDESSCSEECVLSEDAEQAGYLWLIFNGIQLAKPIFNMTKRDEYRLLRRKCPEILKHIHFCETQLPNGKPCGECHACKEYKDAKIFNHFNK